MTDSQAREIGGAIIAGAVIIALAIRPPSFSFDNIVLELAITAVVGVLFGLVFLFIYLWESRWLLPIISAAVVVTGIYFAGPIAAWLGAKPHSGMAVATHSAALPPGFALDQQPGGANPYAEFVTPQAPVASRARR